MKEQGITQKIKNELDVLSRQVIQVQDEVLQYQAAVDAQTEKVNQLQNRLTSAENACSQAKQNTVIVNSLVQQALQLKENSKTTDQSMGAAATKTAELSGNFQTLTRKLIYSGDVANKLANLIIKKRALNPLISDELVTAVTTAGIHANNAVALVLAALQSVFTTQASASASSAATHFTSAQSEAMYHLLAEKEHSLNSMIIRADQQATAAYDEAKKATVHGTMQLNRTIEQFTRSQIKLQSLQAGLAAANAAAGAV